MKTKIAALAAALLLLVAAKPASAVVTGSITVVTPSPAYQQSITFDWSVAGKPKGYEYPMILVECFQSGVEVYGALMRPFASPFTYVLAGGSSAWVGAGGGPADCTAKLDLYPGLHSGPITQLAVVSFAAGG